MLMSADGVDQRPAQQDRHRRRAGDDAGLVAVRLRAAHTASSAERGRRNAIAPVTLESVGLSAGGMFWFTRKKLVGS